MAEADKKDVQEKYIMLQLIDAQIKEIEKELEVLEHRSIDLVNLKSSLDSLASVNSGSQSISPLGLGTYTFTELKDTKHVLVNVGAGIIVKKDTEGAKELVSKQLHQLDGVSEQLTHNLQTLVVRAQQIEEDMRALLE